MFSSNLMLELAEILNSEFGLKLTKKEVEETAHFLVGYFSTLVEVEY